MAPEQQGRRDLVEYPLEDNVRLEVYWRDDRAGYGPAASVFAYDQEILRLDCFGEAKKQGGTGHCHINLKQKQSAAVDCTPLDPSVPISSRRCTISSTTSVSVLRQTPMSGSSRQQSIPKR